MRFYSIRTMATILSVLIAPSLTAANETIHPICPLALQQERVDAEEQELAVGLAESRLTASQSIFHLVDQLWQENLVQGLVYLAAKHDRDVAEIEVKRQQLLLKRQEAEVEQYAIACFPAKAGETAADRKARLKEAHRRYLQADCHRIGKDLAIAEVDLAYRGEVLQSLRDLRENEVTSRQTIIRAERDVEMARKRVDHQQRRVQECASSGVASD